MAFASFDKGDEIEANAEINMVPFIDIMLVLLIIFMITAPLMTHAVKVDLPKTGGAPAATMKPLDVAVTADGQVLVADVPVTLEALPARLRQVDPQTELHLRADRRTPYETVAKVLAAAAEAGLGRIGFVSDPRGR